MTTKQMKRYKEEFTKRYKYLYENASFMLQILNVFKLKLLTNRVTIKCHHRHQIVLN